MCQSYLRRKFRWVSAGKVKGSWDGIEMHGGRGVRCSRASVRELPWFPSDDKRVDVVDVAVCLSFIVVFGAGSPKFENGMEIWAMTWNACLVIELNGVAICPQQRCSYFRCYKSRDECALKQESVI